MSFSLALTHVPSPSMQACERTFMPRLRISYAKAKRQHSAYCDVLRAAGLDVRLLHIQPQMPDCTFIEDTAVVLDEVAILASMGTVSRRPEPAAIESVLREFREIEPICHPATLEGGDVLRVGRTLLVGLSKRSNAGGIASLSRIADRYGYRVICVPVNGCLHLKTACSALPDGRLLLNPHWIDEAPLQEFDRIYVPETEPWGANGISLHSGMIMAAANHRTVDLVRQLGILVQEVDVSEFAKAEGGVTCLSLLL
jgi:dimethylargininase